jgi:regulator of protease activity HflC (stomatin/prohibitin superfamily)
MQRALSLNPLTLAPIGGALVGALILLTSWKTIEPGYVGIVFDKVSHQVTTGVRDPGWAFINPLTEAIQEYPVTIQTYSMVQKSSEGKVSGDDSIKVQSSEGQQLNLDVVIQYEVTRDEANLLYQDWGGAAIDVIEDRIVRQYTRSQVPLVVSQYSWESITTSGREEITESISKRLITEFRKRHLNLVSFGVREVHLPQSLQQALDDKIKAQQLAERQSYALKQAQVQAEQTKVEAQGEASAIEVKARAQAQANQLLSKSLTSELIRSQQIQKWDGKLPTVSTNSSMPMLDFRDGDAKK